MCCPSPLCSPNPPLPPQHLSGKSIPSGTLIPLSLHQVPSSPWSGWSHHPRTTRDPPDGAALPRHRWALLHKSYHARVPRYSYRGGILASVFSYVSSVYRPTRDMNTELQGWVSLSRDCAGIKHPGITVVKGSKPQVLVAKERSNKPEATVTRCCDHLLPCQGTKLSPSDP